MRESVNDLHGSLAPLRTLSEATSPAPKRLRCSNSTSPSHPPRIQITQYVL